MDDPHSKSDNFEVVLHVAAKACDVIDCLCSFLETGYKLNVYKTCGTSFERLTNFRFMSLFQEVYWLHSMMARQKQDFLPRERESLARKSQLPTVSLMLLHYGRLLACKKCLYLHHIYFSCGNL